MITTLQPNQVFVFGSNLRGFHGAGAAGFAFTGKTGNQYRAGNPLLRGGPGTIGIWAVLGIGIGFQTGTMGSSYAIPTVKNPGVAINPDVFHQHLNNFIQFATQHPNLEFLFTEIGKTRDEGGHSYLGSTFVKQCLSGFTIPTNINFQGIYSQFNSNT